MNHFLHGMVRAAVESFELPGPVLEIGSYRVPGQEGFTELRELFPGKVYQGLDLRPGPGVDIVGNVENLPLPDASAGTVLALSTFEHVQHFWRGFEEIQRVLRPDGALIVSCPFYFYIHNYPNDYWRFTPAALKSLLRKYPAKLIGWHGPDKRPANVWALAFREGYTQPEPESLARYARLMALYARRPLSLSRRLRYGVARLFCGRGPFAHYLDQNQWNTEWLPAKSA